MSDERARVIELETGNAFVRSAVVWVGRVAASEENG